MTFDIGLYIMKYSTFYLSEGLKKARKKRKLSQRDLSVKTGITQAQISKFENGVTDLQATSLIELARGLGLELMLVPRELVRTFEVLQRKESHATPAYRLNDEDEENV
jgi:transcriptional regulator with XRE-family HTH domain